jgi:preprotein translocase subunit SecE
VARNRKRAKERRARRPQPVATTREDSTQGPIAHATPDVELAEAQLALGRPDLATEREPEPDDELEEAGGTGGGGAGGPGDAGDGDFDGESPPGGGGELAAPGAPVPAPRPRAHNRLINFLQGSWRELQRVQWPDRRQVMQATGVVIGFVIIAGAFLGVADFVAGKLVTFILK